MYWTQYQWRETSWGSTWHPGKQKVCCAAAKNRFRQLRNVSDSSFRLYRNAPCKGLKVEPVLTQSHRWKRGWRREEALTSAFKARGLWYLVSPVAPLLWEWPPPWLWLWGSTPRSCPRRHSSSSLWPDCEWRGVGKGGERERGEGGVWTVGVEGWEMGDRCRIQGCSGGDIGGYVWTPTEDNNRGEGTRKENGWGKQK